MEVFLLKHIVIIFIIYILLFLSMEKLHNRFRKTFKIDWHKTFYAVALFLCLFAFWWDQIKRIKNNFLDNNSSLDLWVDNKSSGLVCGLSSIDVIVDSLVKVWNYNRAIELLLQEKDSLLQNNIQNCEKEFWNIYSYLWLSYVALEKYDIGFEYYKKAYQIAWNLEDNRKKILNLNDVAYAYIKLKQNENAFLYLSKAYDILEKTDISSPDVAFTAYLIYTNLSNYYVTQKNYNKAKFFFEKAKKLAFSNVGFWEETKVVVLSWEADFLIAEKKYKEAIAVYEEALLLAQKIGHLEYQEWLLNEIKSIYIKQYWNYKLAYEFLEKFSEVRDSRLNIEFQRTIAAKQEEYWTKELQYKNEKQKAELEIQKQNNIKRTVFWVSVSLIALLAWAFYVNSRRKNAQLREKNEIITEQKAEVEKQKVVVDQKNKELEEKKIELQQSNEEIRAINDELLEKNEIITGQKDIAEKQKKIVESQKSALDKAYQELESKTNNIEDSIKYAKKIQNLMIDNTNVFSTIFTNAFALSKPKDILGWDFYYAQKKNNFDVLVLGDCTWHGVPWAMLTIFGVEKTDKSLKNAESPLDVVEDLHKIFTRLHLPFYADMTVEIDNVIKNMVHLFEIYPELKRNILSLNRLIDSLDDYKTFNEFMERFPPRLESILSTMRSIAPDDQCLSENINRIVVAAKTVFDKNPLEFSLLYEKTSILSHDSMEIAVCFFEKSRANKSVADQKYTKLHYSWAGRPVWILRDGEITVYQSRKWDLWSMKYKRNEWTLKEVIDLKKGDLVYVFSDGVVDQFGGPDDKKIGQQRLKEFLLTIKDCPINQQQEQVQKFIENWIKYGSSATKQTDDILFIGVKI